MLSFDKIKKYGVLILVATILSVALKGIMRWQFPNTPEAKYGNIVIFVSILLTAGVSALWHYFTKRKE